MILYIRGKGFAIIRIQIDDTLGVCNKRFAKAKEDKLYKAQLIAKEREHLVPEKPIKFNSRLIQIDGEDITFSQERYYKTLDLVEEKPRDITSSRGIIRKNVDFKGQYIT